MKASDLLCKILSEFGVTKVFGVTGGAILHPLESAHKQGLDVFYTHHEQAASFAADASTRITNQPQACFVTTGPAGTNAITGVLTSWLDSIPQIIISGQTRIDDLTGKNSVRQIGSQHYDILNSISNITNSSVQLKDKETFCSDIIKTLEKSILSRPGPVWIDFPLDLQWAEITNIDYKIIEARKFHYEIHNFLKPIDTSIEKINKDYELLKNAISKLLSAKRPLVLIGAGCKQNGVGEKLVSVFKKYSIPMVFTWGSIDLLNKDDPLNLGILGINGERGANFAAFSTDVFIGFGTHLSDQITGREKELFAHKAEKYIVDLDSKECLRLQGFVNPINLDLRAIINQLVDYILSFKLENREEDNLSVFKELNDFDNDLKQREEYVNLKRFYYYFYKHALDNSIFVSDGGGNTFYSSLQNLKIKKGQRSITSGGSGCMGSGLPQAIGAALSSKERVYCFIGDGSMQFNIQELQTIRHHNLNITIVIVNNSGYQAIIDTQNSYFNGNKFGVNKDSGLSLPDFEKILNAYEIKYQRYTSDQLLSEDVILNICKGESTPNVIELMIKPDTPISPRLSLGKTIEKKEEYLPGIVCMDPQLPDDKIIQLLSIKTW